MNHRRGLKSVPPAPTAVAVEEEDFELVRRFKHDGDLAAFETLFRRHQQYVAGLCLSLLRSHAEAEDAVQEVFIKAYRGLAAFEPKVTFRGWLYRITVNHCRDLIDQRLRRAEDADEDALAAIATLPKQEARLMATMTLEAALAKLKPEYRVAFILQAVEGHTIGEVADALGIGFEAAASRLRRAYQQFVKAYDAMNL
ncbi:MAG TPA: RNA polymerase sigma factor [Blastocatellia bacterium]|nr:RNA polymerase sigma factor [Blastocatellia bacterium]HMV84114.1 RNA polymerase sigma factor [Blastocatellia bacterium]HMX27961.1 RNA polymerase sigma factor [Blastocatellia bacterium]HMY72607.1 RNA polymerase sigma factor [Blastocatellia bacterium]HMZ16822.1 RNA polymerase sigma factor [Blastocatellia bacterium]